MISLTNRNYITGIIIKKIRYKDYHEILQVLTEQGNVESFFYENVHKSKKKIKVSTPYEVSINYFPTNGMNKITNLEIENTYTNIVYDVIKNSYVSNMLEYTYLVNDNSFNIYKLLKLCLHNIESKVSEKIVVSYFLAKLLKEQGFMFKYQKTDYDYVGYSFQKNSFVDKFNTDYSVYGLNNHLVKLTYYLSIKNIDFLESLEIENKDLIRLFSFFNMLFKEFIGVETKSFKKILELEEILGSK